MGPKSSHPYILKSFSLQLLSAYGAKREVTIIKPGFEDVGYEDIKGYKGRHDKPLVDTRAKNRIVPKS
jgi:hypothetical protein